MQAHKDLRLLHGLLRSNWQPSTVDCFGLALPASRVDCSTLWLCRLCLASGERMSLSDQCMNVLLEVDDLTAASPATVSRCGMVYVPKDMLKWQALTEAWLESLPSILAAPFHARQRDSTAIVTKSRSVDDTGAAVGSEKLFGDGEGVRDMIKQLRGLFNRHMDTSLQWLSQSVNESFPTTTQQRCMRCAHGYR
jgi:hypothetical protein